MHTKQYSLKANVRVGALQYGTGLACFAIGSMIYIYGNWWNILDFILSR
jgi:hypothetical protein